MGGFLDNSNHVKSHFDFDKLKSHKVINGFTNINCRSMN